MGLQELIGELYKANLDTIAAALAREPECRVTMRRGAVQASVASVAAIQRRNRLPGKNFIERCCFGALGHRQSELADELRELGR